MSDNASQFYNNYLHPDQESIAKHKSLVLWGYFLMMGAFFLYTSQGYRERTKTLMQSHWRAILVVGLVFSFGLLAPAPVQAAGVVGNGISASCTESALNNALQNGGSISFNCGALPVVITLTSMKTIGVNTSIDGGGLITLSGGNTSALFYVNNFQGVKFTVSNLTFANAVSNQEGAAIHSHYRSILVVTKCIFTNNRTTSSQKQFDGGGGAIFLGSEATGTVSNSAFTSNSGANGGAIYSLNSTLTVTSSTFNGNTATLTSPKGGSGGAIWSDTGTLSIANSTFWANVAALQGGALATAPDATHSIIVNSSTFWANSASASGRKSNGGAITNVRAPNGDGPFTLTNSTLSGNTATDSGGGFWDDTNGVVTMTNVTISSNKAVSADGKSGLGGGMFKGSGTFHLTNITLANNYAGQFGGGVFGSTNITVTNSLIVNNVAHNGGETWNIKNNCSDILTNIGGSIQFPGPNLKDRTDKGCAFGMTTVDPHLGALANNGGSTFTMALPAGSATIGIALLNCPAVDQRGIARHQGCDAGAYESSARPAHLTKTIGMYRPSTHTFYLRNSNTTGGADTTISIATAQSTDLPVAGHWNGGQSDTVGLFRAGMFMLWNDNSGKSTPDFSFRLGGAGDLPMAGDWTHSGHSGVGVFRPTNGLIYLKNSLSTGYADTTMILGIPGDVGLAGDWNGDGIESPGVYRPSKTHFYLSNKVQNSAVYSDYDLVFGVFGDKPVAGDWVGQGHAGIGIFRPTSGLMALRNTLTTGYADALFIFGIPNDVPIAGHWLSSANAPIGQAPPILIPEDGTNTPNVPTPIPTDPGSFDG